MFYHSYGMVKVTIMINKPEYGGLKMINLCSFNKSLKTTWVKRTWTRLTTENGNFSLIQNWRTTAAINISDTKKAVRATNPFLKEILEYWAVINFVDQVSSDIAFQEQFLWFNSLGTDHQKSFWGGGAGEVQKKINAMEN